MPDLIQIIISFLVALSISLYSVPIVVRVDKKLNLFDRPNERSSSVKAIPTLGGIAIFFSFVFATTIGMFGYEMPELIFILAATMLIFFVGLKDDLVNLSPLKKLLTEVIAALIIILPGQIRFTDLHGLFGISQIGLIPGILITTFFIVLIINAFNLTDGIDGLASSLTIMIGSIFGTWFFISGHITFSILSFSLVGASLGFFYFNVYGKQNKIFMGDTGSLVIGTVIAILTIRFNEFNIDQTQPFAIQSVPAISFAILVYPLIDVVRVILIRVLQQQSPFTADKNHLHHRLLTLGLSHNKSTFTIIGINILFISIVFTLHQIGLLRLMSYILFVSSFLFMIPAYIIRRRKLVKRNDPTQPLLIPGLSAEKVIIRDNLPG